MNSDFASILHDLKSLRVQLEQNVTRLEKWRYSRELLAAPVSCVPVHEDVQSCTWGTFMLLENLDIVMMDPPWSLAGAHPTRGVALGYSQMSDASVLQIPVHILQSTGILMVWAINAKYQRCLDMIGHWGYECALLPVENQSYLHFRWIPRISCSAVVEVKVKNSKKFICCGKPCF